MPLIKKYFQAKKTGFWLMLLFAISVLYISCLVLLSPQFPEQGTYSLVDSSESIVFSYPPLIWKDQTTVNIKIPLYLKAIHPHFLTIVPDNCLTKLEVNGNTIPVYSACDWQHGHTFDLQRYLHSGENTLHMSIHNYTKESTFEIKVPLWDPVFSIFHILYVLLVVIIIAKILPYELLRKHYILVSIGTFGLLLRLVYLLGTAYKIRSYDAIGHVNYVFFVLKNLTIPPAGGGWEFFQPPLYYFLCYPLGKFIELLGGSKTTIIFALQIQSMILSCATMLVGFWIAKKIFSAAKDRLLFYLLCAVITVSPGLVFLSTRISNDVLLAFLEFCFVGILLSWWQEKLKPQQNRKMMLIGVITAFGILTKANAIPLIGIVVTCILFKENTWRTRLRSSAIFLGIIFMCIWWLLFVRIFLENQTHIVGNIARNNPLLQIKDFSILNFFVFRPFHVLIYPFNSSWVDTFGRPYYWEHLVKSTINGEWNFGVSTHLFARMILISIFALSLYGIWSFVKNIRSFVTQIPLISIVIFLVISQMYLLIDTKVGGFSDFRYVTILIIPFFYYALRGIQQSKGIFRRIGYFTMYILILGSVLFIHTILFAFRSMA